MATASSSQLDPVARFSHVDKVLDNPGPYTDPDSFNAGEGVKSFLRDQCKILVIGAGGLGCELLMNLALLGFKDIHVIDMDTIDVSNLNRQFLFRPKDVGRPKAVVAAEFVNARVPGTSVTPYHGKIQDKDDDYYMSFNLVICGLDSIEARRWINATLVNLADPENPESYKPLIDGGTEGFKGQSRVILPTISSCYECSLDLITPPTAYPICTIASTPRIPEHCIEWASVLEWPRVFKDKKLDGDDPDDIQWLFDQASARAKEFGIEGVSWSLTQGVVKNIIPAVASTNAIIAASCANEAFKIATSSAPYLDNYMLYVGTHSVYTHTFSLDRKEHCPVCGGEAVEVTRPASSTLSEMVDWLLASPSFQIKKPSLTTGTKQLFMQGPKQLRDATSANLEKRLDELFHSGEDVAVTDSGLPFSLSLRVAFE